VSAAQKVHWIVACIAGAVLVVFLPPANGKQGLIPEEIYQTLLLTKKKQGRWTKFPPTQTRE
jgi:hypothetical protein